MSMIRTARGSWHKPFYHIEKLDDFYENERKPIGTNENAAVKSRHC